MAGYGNKKGNDAIVNSVIQFRLWHMLAVITCVAILLATLRVSSAITITLLVSVVPATPSTLYFKKPTWSRVRLTAEFIAASLFWFLLYALSFGPALWLVLTMGWKINLEIPYSPIVYLYHFTPLKELIEWYLKFWTNLV
jgi:hypothetical protein